MNKAFLMRVLVSLLLVLVSGCGSSGSSSASSTSYISSTTQALFQAIENRNVAAVKRAIDNGANVNARNRRKNTPLIELLNTGSSQSTYEIMELLIKHGANVNGRDKYGYTPLYSFVALSSNPDLATLLIENGANVNARNKYGQTPLDRTMFFNDDGDYDDVIAVLRTNPAEIMARKEKRIAAEKAEEEKRIVAEKAVEEERIAEAKAVEEKEKLQTLIPELITRGAVDERDADTNTALHIAAKNNKTEYIEQLIQAGADVHILNKKADTPLHFAAREGARDATVTLLRTGGNPYTLNLKGKSALAIAVESGNEDLLGDFVLAGVDVSAIVNLTQSQAQRDWEAKQERQRQAEVERLAAEAKLEAGRLAAEAAAERSTAEYEAKRLAEEQRDADIAAQWAGIGDVLTTGIQSIAAAKNKQRSDQHTQQTLSAAQRQAAAAERLAAAAEQRANAAAVTQTPVTPPKRSHSAIAESTGSGRWGVGMAWARSSMLAADNDALRGCRSTNATGTCSIVHRWEGPGCVGTAKRNDGVVGAWATASSRSAADRSALNRCGSNCVVTNNGGCSTW